MFIKTMRISVTKIALVVVALGVIIAAAFWTRGQVAVQADTSPKYTGVDTNEKRIKFLETYGWKVDASPLEVVEVTIPQTFNAVYNNYNSIQKKQGFDLTKYTGKRVKRWTYRVTNYPGATEEVRANLLIYNNTVIGGDISTVSLGGFMQGFARQDGDAVGVSPQSADITQNIFAPTS